MPALQYHRAESDKIRKLYAYLDVYNIWMINDKGGGKHVGGESGGAEDTWSVSS